MNVEQVGCLTPRVCLMTTAVHNPQDPASLATCITAWAKQKNRGGFLLYLLISDFVLTYIHTNKSTSLLHTLSEIILFYWFKGAKLVALMAAARARACQLRARVHGKVLRRMASARLLLTRSGCTALKTITGDKLIYKLHILGLQIYFIKL